jgi:flagellar biosynthesis protein FlhF
MRLETFTGRDLATVRRAVHTALGPEAVLLRTRAVHAPVRGIEVVVADAREVAAFHDRLDTAPLPAREAARPRLLAVVGPTGAGKTTTLAKLATNACAFGGRSVGLLTLDSHRAAAFEQLAAYADAAGLPCHMAYDVREAHAALRAMQDCDVVLVDTAGFGHLTTEAQRRAMELLAVLEPDETHLVLPATMRAELVAPLLARYTAVVPTHVLPTKLDDAPGDLAVTALLAGADRPCRWATMGQEIPDAIDRAALALPRLLDLVAAPRLERAS